VNCLGDVLDPATGEVLAGVLQEDGSGILNTEDIMMENISGQKIGFTANTTLGTVVTNASLTKPQATKVASMAHNGYARTIRPAHTMVDGDTIFTVATGNIPCDISVVGMLAARVVGRAVSRAVLMAEPLMGHTCAKDLHP